MHLDATYGVYTCMYCNSGAGSRASAKSRAASRSAAVLLAALPGPQQAVQRLPARALPVIHRSLPFKCQNAASPPHGPGVFGLFDRLLLMSGLCVSVEGEDALSSRP